MESINKRFRDGGKSLSSELVASGVLIHHFDNMASALKPWEACPVVCYGKPCWCADTRDRLSATFINAQLPKGPNDRIPTYHDVAFNAAAGFVLSPYYTKILCSYPSDGGTSNRKCDPPGVSAECVPGCHRFDRNGGGPLWCSSILGSAIDGECAWQPTSTLDMLRKQRVNAQQSQGQALYNEVIVDFADWKRWHPHSIEAVWYMDTYGCDDQGSAMMCERYAREVHANLLAAFGLSAGQLPLLVLDPAEWQTPFSVAAAT